MRVISLVYAIPDAPAEIDASRGPIEPGSRTALETGLALAEATGGTCTAVAAGTPDQDAALHAALARGAHRAVRVTDPSIREGGIRSLAAVLASAIKRVGYDVVIAGARSRDWASGATGPAVAHFLGVAHATACASVRAAEGGLAVEHLADDGLVTLRMRLPSVVCVTVAPRPTLASHDRSQEDPITTIEAADMTVPFRPHQLNAGRIMRDRSVADCRFVTDAAQLLIAMRPSRPER